VVLSEEQAKQIIDTHNQKTLYGMLCAGLLHVIYLINYWLIPFRLSSLTYLTLMLRPKTMRNDVRSADINNIA